MNIRVSLSLSLSLSLSPHLTNVLPLSLNNALAVSVLAFDQYGQLTEQLEQESAMRERAETLATQVYPLQSQSIIISTTDIQCMRISLTNVKTMTLPVQTN